MAKVKKKRFKYKARSDSQVEDRINKGSGAFDTITKEAIPMFKAAENKNRVRILPPTWEDPEHYGLDIFVHYGVGPDNQTYLCPSKMNQGDCPVCEERRRAQKGDDPNYIRELSPTRRVLCWVISRAEEDKGPMLWSVPVSMDLDISVLRQDEESGECLNIDDPEKGYDVLFKRTGKGIKTRYTGLAISRRSSAVSTDPDDVSEWMEFIIERPLPELLKFFSYDYIQGVFSGEASEAKADDDEDTDTRASRRRPKKGKRPAAEDEEEEDVDEEEEDDEDDDEDDEEEEEDEEDDEEDEEGEEDEEEDDEEDEEEEEEQPRRSKVRAKKKKKKKAEEEPQPTSKKKKSSSLKDRIRNRLDKRRGK